MNFFYYLPHLTAQPTQDHDTHKQTIDHDPYRILCQVVLDVILLPKKSTGNVRSFPSKQGLAPFCPNGN